MAPDACAAAAPAWEIAAGSHALRPISTSADRVAEPTSLAGSPAE
jgi:hypothetical protein